MGIWEEANLCMPEIMVEARQVPCLGCQVELLLEGCPKLAHTLIQTQFCKQGQVARQARRTKHKREVPLHQRLHTRMPHLAYNAASFGLQPGDGSWFEHFLVLKK